MRELHVIGGGDHASVLADAARAAGVQRIVLWADYAPKLERFPKGTEGRLLTDLTPDTPVMLGIGDIPRRRELRGKFPLMPPALIHPAATVAASAKIGDGVAVMAGAIVNPNARIDPDAILNTGCIVEHDCVVGRNTHVAPGAVLAGEAIIGADAHIGAGAVVLEDRHVGDGAMVGAGAVVVKHVEPGATVVGVPARPR